MSYEFTSLPESKKVPYMNNGYVWQVISSLPTPLLMVNHNGLIDYINTQAERFLGMSENEVVGSSCASILNLRNAEGKSIAIDPREIQKATHSPDGGKWLLVNSSDGDEIPVQVSVALIDDPEDARRQGFALMLHEVSEIRHLVEHLLHKSSHDPLTGLANREEFNARLARAIRSTTNGKSEHALLFMDLDNFKRVNDSYGHQTGDVLLQTIAGRFRSVVRDRDTLARFGGDEFMLLLEHCDIKHAIETARMLQLAIHEVPVFCNGEIVKSEVSVGIATIYQSNLAPETIVAQADAACYVAKRNAKGRIRVYEYGDQDMDFVLSNVIARDAAIKVN